jgi:carboxylesterase
MLREKLIGGIRRWCFVLLIVGIVSFIVFILFTPWNIAYLTSHPHPVQSYAEALQRIKALRIQEVPDMNPVCRLQFMTHDRQVKRVIVLVHGYTNCPQQFHEFGQRFYNLGYNVLLAPLPHQGLADRMTEEQAQLKAEELITYTDEMVDIAHGLGKQVVLVGFSGSGVTTAWAAQYRRDIDLAVIISPIFGFQQIPTPLTVPAANLYLALPNSFRWWDPSCQDSCQEDSGPTYAYPRYSTRALAEIVRLGSAVQVTAQRESPAAHSILVVTNANDPYVNNALTDAFVKVWREHNAHVTTYEFEAALRLGHDLIDPTQPDERIDIVYPRLIDLITQEVSMPHAAKGGIGPSIPKIDSSPE